jgi:hypothetical protein
VGKQVQKPDRAADSQREAKAHHRNELTANLLDIGSCAPSSSCHLTIAFIPLYKFFPLQAQVSIEHAESRIAHPQRATLPPRTPNASAEFDLLALIDSLCFPK